MSKIKNGALNQYGAGPSLEQLALKGLIIGCEFTIYWELSGIVTVCCMYSTGR